MICEIKVTLNMCDTNVKIAESNDPVYLYVKRGITPICRHELMPISGDVFLTDLEILDFANEGITYKLQLRDENNTPVDFMYFDCSGTAQTAEHLRVSFLNCEDPNLFLYEDC